MHRLSTAATIVILALTSAGCGGEGESKERPELPVTVSTSEPKRLEGNVIQLVDDREREGVPHAGNSSITLTLGKVGSDHLMVDWLVEAGSIDLGLMPNDSFVLFVGINEEEFQSYQVILYPVRPGETWEVVTNRTRKGRQEASKLAVSEWMWPSSRTSNGLRLSGQVALKLPPGAMETGRIAAVWIANDQQGNRGVAAVDPKELSEGTPETKRFRPFNFGTLPARDEASLGKLRQEAETRSQKGKELGDALDAYHKEVQAASEEPDLRERAKRTREASQALRELAGEMLSDSPWLIPAWVQRIQASTADQLDPAEVSSALQHGLFTVNMALDTGVRLLRRGRVNDFADVALSVVRAVKAASPAEVPLLTNYLSGEVSRLALMQPRVNGSLEVARRLTSELTELAGPEDPAVLRMKFHCAVAIGGDAEEAQQVLIKLAEAQALTGALNEARAAVELCNDDELGLGWIRAVRAAAEGTTHRADVYLSVFMLADRLYRGSADYDRIIGAMEAMGPPPEGVETKVEIDFGVAREVTLDILRLMAAESGHSELAKKLSDQHFGTVVEGEALLLRQSALVSAIRVTWGNAVDSRRWDWASKRWPALVELLAKHARPEMVAAFAIDLASQAMMHGDLETAGKMSERVANHYSETLVGDENATQRNARYQRMRLTMMLLSQNGVSEQAAGVWQRMAPSERAQFVHSVINDAGGTQTFGTGPRLLLGGHDALAERLRGNLLGLLGSSEEDRRFALSAISSFAATAVKLRVGKLADAWLTDFRDFIQVLGEDAESKYQEFLILEQTLVADAVAEGRLNDASALVTAWLNRNPKHGSAPHFERMKQGIESAKKAAVQDAIDREREPADLPLVRIVTDAGSMEVLLYAEDAPNTVSHFLDLCRRGFYSNKLFHRVIPGFVAQAGYLGVDGTDRFGERIPLEAHRYHRRGTIAMAREGNDSAHGEAFDSASGDFYFTSTDTSGTHLDAAYAVFGRVVTGLDVMDSLRLGTTIERIEILRDREMPAPKRLPPIYRVPDQRSAR